jgi:Domain of unknown function (DUF4328)
VSVGFLIWQHSAATVARGPGYPSRTSPGFGVGSWFIPVINLWFPYWALSDTLPPEHPIRGRCLWAWLAYLGAGVAGAATFFVALVSNAAAIMPMVISGLGHDHPRASPNTRYHRISRQAPIRDQSDALGRMNIIGGRGLSDLMRRYRRQHRSWWPRAADLSILPSLRRQFRREPVGQLTALAKPDTLLVAEPVGEFERGPAVRLGPLVLAIPSDQPDQEAPSRQALADDAPHQVRIRRAGIRKTRFVRPIRTHSRDRLPDSSAAGRQRATGEPASPHHRAYAHGERRDIVACGTVERCLQPADGGNM